jgi:hypothetical protein
VLTAEGKDLKWRNISLLTFVAMGKTHEDHGLGEEEIPVPPLS